MNAAERATESDGGRASVKATITIPLSVLIGSLVNAGHAVTALGQIIDAGTARALACSARLVPMVIGTQSQPLDIGRATRCFHPAPRQAIVNRDRECTFPGVGYRPHGAQRGGGDRRHRGRVGPGTRKDAHPTVTPGRPADPPTRRTTGPRANRLTLPGERCAHNPGIKPRPDVSRGFDTS
ncbi:DUF222 domain-containing protein [Leekyejoonella antrihumi]|uniref:DUF222 domain-containing protein n=1 Tax=Leekyejoonella antrihumi TaxID=1660198 RepID=UPI001648C828